MTSDPAPVALVIAHWPMTELVPDPDRTGTSRLSATAQSLQSEWTALEVQIRTVESQFPGIRRVREGVWEVLLDTGLTPLVALCDVLEDRQGNLSYGYRVLFFDASPKWICTRATRAGFENLLPQ